MYNPEVEQTKHLAEYYFILTKHKWTIIASFILIVSLTILYNSRMKPVYRATTFKDLLTG